MFKKILLLSSLILNSTLLYAGLAITPSRAEINLAPGQFFEGKYTVRNDYSTPVDVKVESRNWFLLPEEDNRTIDSWLTVQTPEFSLQPGESREVPYQVKLSTDAKGVRVGMLSFVPQTVEEQGLTLVISASVFVTAAGSEKVSWDLSGVKVDRVFDRLQVTAQVKNRGNIHLRPVGSVTIVTKGKAVAQLEFREGRPVYPGMERTVVANSDAPVLLPKGKYAALLKLNAAGEAKECRVDFRVGPNGEITKK